MNHGTVKLSVREYGDGEPVVIVHGLFGSKDNWHTAAQSLASDFRVIIPDLRNHGQSPHCSDMDYENMAADLQEMFDSQKIQKAHLVGHSMGVKVVLSFAMKWPDRVQKLVLVDMAHREYKARHTKILEALQAVPSGQFHKRSEADSVLGEKISDPLVRAFLLKSMHRADNGTLHWRLNVAAIVENYPKLGRAIEMKIQPQRQVLLISGGKSDYVTERDVEALGGYFPRLETKQFADASHWVHYDVGDDFISEVKAFLMRKE